MRNRSLFSPLRWFSALFVLAALILTIINLVQYSRTQANFPAGMKIAGVPVGGMDRQLAAQRLVEAYSIPIELVYNQALIQVSPSVIDFQLDLDSMLGAADLQRTQNNFWVGFWDFLWGRSTSPTEVPLRSTFSKARLQTYLENEVAKRYDQPPVAAKPVVGTVNFEPGAPGTVLNVEASLGLVESSLNSLSQRQVVLPLERTQPPRPAFDNLKILLKQTVDLAGFDGLAGIYLHDLQTNQEVHLEYRQGKSCLFSRMWRIPHPASSRFRLWFQFTAAWARIRMRKPCG